MGYFRVATLASIALCSAFAAVAGDHEYACRVLQVYDLAADGHLASSAWDASLKDGSFTVSRDTGDIVGQVLPTALAKSVRVVNRGSKQNAFKAVADFGEQIQIIEIQEFRDGPVKPFVAASMGGAGIVSGVCR